MDLFRDSLWHDVRDCFSAGAFAAGPLCRKTAAEKRAICRGTNYLPEDEPPEEDALEVVAAEEEELLEPESELPLLEDFSEEPEDADGADLSEEPLPDPLAADALLLLAPSPLDPSDLDPSDLDPSLLDPSLPEAGLPDFFPA